MIIHQRRPRSRAAPLAVAVCIVVAAAALVMWQVRSAPSSVTNSPATDDTRNASDANGNAAAEAKTTFEDPEFGFALAYPSAWNRSRDENGSGDERVVNYVFGTNKEGVTLVIVPTAMEGIIRESFSIKNETTVTINGAQARRASGTTAKDGSPITLLFFRKDATVFVLNGPAAQIDAVGAAFMFTAP